MNLVQDVQQFIYQPYPLWENELTQKLVQHKWEALKQYGITTANDYSTARGLYRNLASPIKNMQPLNPSDTNTIYLEAPSFETLRPFYDEHGLSLLTEEEIHCHNVVPKLQKALAILKQVEPAHQCITKLVRRIQVLKQEDPEIDISYSHPDIPFSVFVTVCEDDSEVSGLRVAESILHEAMHLKLTLIEEIISLVKENTSNLFYSPWRGEKRPVQGILHALFVFRTLLEFYKGLNNTESTTTINDFSSFRMKEIVEEISQIEDFKKNLSLTRYGANLTKNLLPSN